VPSSPGRRPEKLPGELATEPAELSRGLALEATELPFRLPPEAAQLPGCLVADFSADSFDASFTSSVGHCVSSFAGY